MGQENSKIRLTIADSSIRYLLPNAATSFEINSETGSATVGRETDVNVQIRSQIISRKHAVIEHDGQSWTIRDLGSKAGTRVNHASATVTQSQQIESGDQIFLGPIVLNVRFAQETEPTFNLKLVGDGPNDRTSIIARDVAGSVSTIADAALGGLAQHRLAVLLRSAARLTEAPDLATLSEAITQSASSGTASPRALLIGINADDQWEVLGSFPEQDSRVKEIEISRSLVALACKGRVAELQFGDGGDFHEAMSIETLNIRSAICAPISVDNKVEAVLYLDTRGTETPIKPDAAAFCVALAQLGGMAFANLKRAEIARQEKEMRDELKAARIAQQQMIPESTGQVGPVRYSLEAVPGMIVAGDLFDIIALEDDCALVMLGDVMGKGAAAGLMMAMIQTYFRASSHAHVNLSTLLENGNSYFFERFKGNCFVTMWVGLFTASTGKLSYVDAGHGHWCHFPQDSEPVAVESSGGPPLGAFAKSDYEAGELELHPRDRIILFSDGMIEQHDSAGNIFGEADVLKCLASSRSAEEDVQLLLDAHRTYRGAVPLSDDLTIASIEWIDKRSDSNA